MLLHCGPSGNVRLLPRGRERRRFVSLQSSAMLRRGTSSIQPPIIHWPDAGIGSHLSLPTRPSFTRRVGDGCSIQSQSCWGRWLFARHVPIVSMPVFCARYSEPIFRSMVPTAPACESHFDRRGDGRLTVLTSRRFSGNLCRPALIVRRSADAPILVPILIECVLLPATGNI